ncbi:MAG: hypothetical protein GY787_16710 [Alteromonadales bacterium]|nr:hypothetical protein [Alteromonadales bacterium]
MQNYFDNRKKKAEAVKKKKNAYQLALNDVTLNYNNSLNSATEDINQSTLFQDVQDQARARLDGNEFGIGVIEMATQLKMNPDLDRNTRAEYLKAVSDYQTWQSGIVNKIGATIVDIEPLEGMNAGNIGQGFDFAGTGNEKFQNMVVANTLANKSFSGIQSSKTLNGNMLSVDMVVNPNDDMIKKYVKEGILDLEDLKPAEDGNYYFNWTRNIDKWEGGLITEVPSSFDSITALETAGIVDKKGLPKEGFFTEKVDVVTNIAGTDKQRVSTKQYFNPDILENNPTFKAETLKYAKGLNQLPTGQILSALENHFNEEISADEWLSKTADQQNELITSLIIEKEMDRMTGGFQQETVDGEVRYYQQSEGKLIERPSKDSSATSTKQSEDAVANIEELDISSAFAEGPSQEPGRGVLNLNTLEKLISRSPYNFIVTKVETVGGEDTRKLTKSVEGADRSVTIFDSATDGEVKAALKFLETGVSFKPTANVEIDNIPNLP